MFTSVSSNGMTPNTAIIWAAARPSGDDNHVTLHAYNGTASAGNLAELWSGVAGFWANVERNANLVPTIANGKVYVGTYQELAIFGLTGSPNVARNLAVSSALQVPRAPAIKELPGVMFWGTIKSVHRSRIVVVLRTGKLLQVDLREALKNDSSVVPLIGRHVALNGKFNSHGILEARFMWGVKGPGSWGADHPGEAR
jgi:hypothetical protein